MDPCTSAEMFGSGFGYFNPLDQAGIINQALSFLVRDSEPSWFYCKQEQPVFHCEAGMVFGINVGDGMGAFLATSRPGGLSTSMLVRRLARQLSHFWTLLTYLNFPTSLFSLNRALNRGFNWDTRTMCVTNSDGKALFKVKRMFGQFVIEYNKAREVKEAFTATSGPTSCSS